MRWFLALCAMLAACGKTSPPAPTGLDAVYDTSALPVTKLDADPQARRRVLGMPFGEAAARLGALSFDATATYRWSRGKRQLEQRDTFHAAQTPDGDFEVDLSTPQGSVGFALIGGYVYVRQNRDPVRKKPRRDVETSAWTDTAYASIGQVLDLFGGRVRLTDPQAETLPEREAIRYRVALGTEAEEVRYGDRPSLPHAPRSRWREQATPLDLEGQLWIDKETGVVLGLRLAGKLEIKDREVRPTEVSIAYDGRVSQVGKVLRLRVPQHIDELQREAPPADVLGFFREHLPPPEVSD